MLYGTAWMAGPNADGTVFAVRNDGTAFTNLHNFAASEGANPSARMVLYGNSLFGTTEDGGTYGNGTVFAVQTDGTGFRTLHSFTGSDGSNPVGGLYLSCNTLYGATESGGPMDTGTLFAITVNPIPVPLNFQVSGQVLVLSWANSSYSLASSGSLTGPWQVVSGAVSRHTTVMSETAQFYRLVGTSNP
jgi:uncharacterized repeat protein (TIGR03803 family)